MSKDERVRKYGKLVRDKMFDKIREDGFVPIGRQLTRPTDIRYAYQQKILEEATEVFEAFATDEVTEELGDLIQVINDFLRFEGVQFQAVVSSKLIDKYEENGGFRKYCWLDEIKESE